MQIQRMEPPPLWHEAAAWHHQPPFGEKTCEWTDGRLATDRLPQDGDDIQQPTKKVQTLSQRLGGLDDSYIAWADLLPVLQKL